MEISENKLVKLHYKGTLDDGTVFDSSEGKEPLEFIFGVGMIIPGLEVGIKGLKVGDKKSVKVESKDAYGEYKDEALNEVPKTQFPPEAKLEVGMQLAAQSPMGVIPVRVAEIKDDSVLVDFNHPLAGKDLVFDVEIVEVNEATPEDMAKFMPQQPEGGCGDGGCDSCGTEGCGDKQ
ncbi:MAG: FKBP-type peptidyl-prolyl cis-trans isomerase [Nanoarchaeota archaeon]